MVGINMPFTAFPGIPFGGYKQSGFGRELSIDTLDLYLETKGVLALDEPEAVQPVRPLTKTHPRVRGGYAARVREPRLRALPLRARDRAHSRVEARALAVGRAEPGPRRSTRRSRSGWRTSRSGSSCSASRWSLGGTPGVGTVANAVLVGSFIQGLTSIDAFSSLSHDGLSVRIPLLVVGHRADRPGVGVLHRRRSRRRAARHADARRREPHGLAHRDRARDARARARSRSGSRSAAPSASAPFSSRSSSGRSSRRRSRCSRGRRSPFRRRPRFRS